MRAEIDDLSNETTKKDYPTLSFSLSRVSICCGPHRLSIYGMLITFRKKKRS